jgi:protein-tyrosine-phosphatase
MPGTVVFVCQHGAGKSRLAAAWFNADPPPGWQATSAGIEPQTSVSLHAPRLLAGTAAAAHLDRTLPRPIADIPAADLTIAIDCAVPDSVGWQLSNAEFDDALADEIRRLVTELVQALRSNDQTPVNRS